MSRKLIGAVVVILAVVGTFVAGQYYGRRSKRPVEWYSQIGGRFVIDEEIHCKTPDGKQGKSLGKIQVDLNLTNGKWRVVRNDPGKWPTCD